MYRISRPITLFSMLFTMGMPLIVHAVNPVTTRIGVLTSSLYSYALTMVGLAVFVMFLIAGIATMVPALQKSLGGATPFAIIKDAIIGLIILVSAFVILNSINPDLVGSGAQEESL